jgi:endonuclease YncB( thermonuclease family)
MKKPMIISVFLVLILTAPAILLAEATQVLPQVQTYDQLLAAIRAARNASRARIEAMAGREKVREAWETGRLIDGHVLQHKERADYGTQVIARLAGDLVMSERELYYMLEFYRAYPILPLTAGLSWSHYRDLLSVNDREERDALAGEAAEKQWNQKEVRQAVREAKARKGAGASPAAISGAGIPAEPDVLKDIAPGPLDTFQIVRLGDSLKIDLGFGIYRDLPEKDAAEYKEGDRVTSAKNTKGNYSLKTPSPNPLPFAEGRIRPTLFGGKGEDIRQRTDPSEELWRKGEGALYTYRAKATQVVDGDTFHALIDLGFGTTLAQRVRLRRIDAPEIYYKDSATEKADPSLSQTTTQGGEGLDAKAALEDILARDQGRVILQSRELDQHGRPIADVWVEGKSIDQELLDQGLAVKMED